MKIVALKESIAMVFIISFVFLAILAIPAAQATVYVGNISNVQAYLNNLVGIKVAWVNSKWTFEADTSNGGYFYLNANTFLVTSDGHNALGNVAITGTYTSESSTLLFSSVDFVMKSAVATVTGTFYNNPTSTGTGQFVVYWGTYGDFTESNLMSLPIDVGFSLLV